jgi:hypothetical protein
VTHLFNMAEIDKKWSRLAVKSLIYGLLCLPADTVIPLIPYKFTHSQLNETFLGFANIYVGLAAYLFAYQAIRFGIYGLKEIRKNPSTQKGTWFAILGIFLAISPWLMLLEKYVFHWFS